MESRGQKRAEEVEELPADKRACNSFEFRPSSSSSSPSSSPVKTTMDSMSLEMETHGEDRPSSSSASPMETTVNSESLQVETHGEDGPSSSSATPMETTVNSGGVQVESHGEDRPSSSSNPPMETTVNSVSTNGESHGDDIDRTSTSSVSSESDEEDESDSTNGDCDARGQSDPRVIELRSLRDQQRRRSEDNQENIRGIIANLKVDGDGDGMGKLAALTELCELLSFCSGDSMPTSMSQSLASVLVKLLARQEITPDVMLLAIRAISYMCDNSSTASRVLAEHGAVPALCQRLLSIEYLDVAEQCFQALDKISRDQPVVCLDAGAIMAALSFIDFFSANTQRVAISIVVNICRKLRSDRASAFMEAVPILCNLLQNGDQRLIENVAICLISIVDKAGESPEVLDKLCQHELVNQATRLIDLNGRTTLSQPIHTGLIRLLVKLASGSLTAVVTLVDLNISSILKDILSSYQLSHGMPSSIAEGQCNQVHVVLKLLNTLLPTITRGNQDVEMASDDKELFLANQPDLLQNFATDILTTLIQVVDSGANLDISWGCLTIINKIVYFSKPDMLLVLLKSINMSSFLAGVLTRKDHHVLILALEITESLLQKLSDHFLNSLVKEGVLFAVGALITPEKISKLIPPVLSDTDLSNEPSKKSLSKEAPRCLCYALDTSRMAKNNGNCKIDKDYAQNLAKRIRTSYFTEESFNSERGLTDIFHKLQLFSVALINLLNMPINNDTSAEHEEICYSTMCRILTVLTGSEPVSTFEFIESGIVKSLTMYLSNGQHLGEKEEHHIAASNSNIVEKRLEGFARQLSSLSESICGDFPLSMIIRKLIGALSSVENFPVILSNVSKKSNSYTTIPRKQCMTYPTFKVCFVREEAETSLSDYSKGVQTVDPLSSIDAIAEFLWPKVLKSTAETECVKACAKLQSNSTPSEVISEGNIPHQPEDLISSALREMQVDGLSHSVPEPKEAVNARQLKLEEKHEGHITSSPVKLEPGSSSESDTGGKAEDSGNSSTNDGYPKLSFYLQGHLLDRSLTLYQAILQQEMNDNNEMFNYEKLWSEVYTLTYKKSPDNQIHLENGQISHVSSVSDNVGGYRQLAPNCSVMFDSELAYDLNKSSPTYNILFLLKSLQSMNRSASHLMSQERVFAFAEGKIKNMDDMKMLASTISQHEFLSSKLTEKLEQQLRDPLALSVGGLPSWCNQLMASYPFLFGFETRRKYFHLAAFGTNLSRLPPAAGHSNGHNRTPSNGLPRKRFLVCRDHILDSAAKMMDLHAGQKVVLEVEYEEEVGTGLGPTLEFYTLVSQEFQKPGLGLWRAEDHSLSNSFRSLENENYEKAVSRYGLFPRPWSSTTAASTDTLFCEVLKKFVLLGQVVAKSLQDGRVLDVPISKAFYKLILGQELNLYDINSFDPELGRTLIEFKALVERKRFSDSVCGVNATSVPELFRGTRIEDLHLDFTLPGYSDYMLASRTDYNMVYMSNLEEYVALVVDATVGAGVSRQVEAFRSGFNQVFPIKHLHIFTEEEIENLLCGERSSWDSSDFLDHAKFDHGYTASSTHILNLLEIIQELDFRQRRAFLQFVTGAPRLPPGGLASLNPKLTIVRKHCDTFVDAELPSVMTCANYFKLPPYSSKEIMKEKLLYAITEGQGSFHLS